MKFYLFLCVCVCVCVCANSLRKFQSHKTVLSTIITMLYARSSDLIHLIDENLYPFHNLFLFPPVPGNHFLISVFMSLTGLWVFVCCWDPTQVIHAVMSFCVWFISYTIIPSRFIHVVSTARYFFLMLNNILYHFSIDRNIRLFPYLGYCEQCCSGHGGAYISLISCFPLLWKLPRSGISGSHGGPIFKFLRNIQYCFP